MAEQSHTRAQHASSSLMYVRAHMHHRCVGWGMSPTCLHPRHGAGDIMPQPPSQRGLPGLGQTPPSPPTCIQSRSALCNICTQAAPRRFPRSSSHAAAGWMLGCCEARHQALLCVAPFGIQRGGYKKEGNRLFNMICQDRARGDGFKLKEGRDLDWM